MVISQVLLVVFLATHREKWYTDLKDILREDTL